MKEHEKQTIQGKKAIFQVTKYSRRQFLKSAAIVTVGAAISSISLAPACKSSESTTSGPSTGVDPTTGGPATSNASATSYTAPSSISTNPATGIPASTNPPATTPAGTGYSYVPPAGLPPLITVTGTACTVATDRVYSANHIWVKSLTTNLAVMGITTTMVDILNEPNKLSLSPVGTVLASDDDFGSIEGFKLSADLSSPVSGTLVQINDFLIELAKLGSAGISPIDNDPYNSGWLVVVQLSKPSELNSLLTPQAYRDLVAQS